MTDFLDTPLTFLKGMGEKRAQLYSKELGIKNFRDLIYYFPYRHIDRSKIYKIAELTGETLPQLQIKGKIIGFYEEGEGRRKRLKATFTDGEKMMELVWFSKYSYVTDKYKLSKEYLIFGKPTFFNNYYSIAHPEIEEYNPSKVSSGFRGMYSVTDTFRKKGGSSNQLLDKIKNLLSHPGFRNIKDPIPEVIRKKYHLSSLQDSLKWMHFPETPEQLQRATERMKFEELFYIESHILRFSLERNARSSGYKFSRIGNYFNDFFYKVLPFELTDAQKKVIREIRSDVNTGKQMNRLLQGDVGSGKTLVAFMSMLIACDNGCQAALMAPTEILATQHYNTLKEWADKIGIKLVLLTGSTKKKERALIHAGLQSGEINIIVGTHALLEENVKFSKLGFVVIDEQHRFGVAQRARMWNKNEVSPHMLVMTATPIPRTLAMTVYGDLEVSIIDSLPPGRKPVLTLLRFDDSRIEVDRLIYSQLKEGRQVYIVYPLINENDKLELKSLENGYQRTCEVFKDYKVCFVHGKMKPDEKDYQMNLFLSKEARIMVATTVIEVGVNVPNASVMVIENAERFGLSQLHQLRGRVGRGAEKSYCVLMSKANVGSDTKKRLQIMTETTDGFLISEADMKIRGPGDMEGTQQSGLAFNLKVANLAKDGQILTVARKAALDILANNVQLIEIVNSNLDIKYKNEEYILNREESDIMLKELKLRFSHEINWSKIS